MNNIKIKRIVFSAIVVILIFLFIFFQLDYRLYLVKKKKKDNKNCSLVGYIEKYKDVSEEQLINGYIYKKNIGGRKRKFAKLLNKDSNLAPLLIFGDCNICNNLTNYNETFPYFLSLYTKRPVFDQSTPFTKPQHILFSLQNDNFYKRIYKKPEYIIYLYVPFHIIEVSTKCSRSVSDLFYKLKKNKLERYKNIPLYKKSYLIGWINNYLFKNEITKDLYYSINENLYKEILINSKIEAQKHWGGEVKFVIIRYLDMQNQKEDLMFEDLKSKGFIVFELYKYFDTRSAEYSYPIDNKTRPNAKLWKSFIPIMIKELNINQALN